MKLITAIFIILSPVVVFSQDKTVEVKNLDINNEYPHFALMPLNGNQIVFTSYRLKKNGKVKVAFTGEGVLSVYKGNIGANGTITNIKEIKIDTQAGLGSITSATLSADGKRIYIMTTYTDKNMPKGNFNKANFHLEIGEFRQGVGFTNFKVLPFCKPRFSYAHPALSADGKTLYFTANVKGGRQSTKGGSDIFMVDVLGDNTYGEIKNLGSKVNSYSREMFPVVSSDNTLYFSSDKSNGFGGYDIYKSKKNSDGTFTKAEKLPKPFNSKEDDFSLVQLNNNSGFLVSERDGGKGDNDIYFFHY
ncbi:hypothetical protein EYD45_05820 [Hyunsoonleella flava]|uniref:WD40-like Beta Propeller Repeat n=1 Tax=Hyunsoonleella flava TaxID=2527939 RepID=A0A4Q9FF08_9FLAO|nr:PD40 domain-containing protein [Hyunsoonleella flava]TBN04777.1 hypothetical protein EYD45_05820 [Hyunsoonleella flava]